MQKMSGLDLKLAVAELALLEGKRISRIRRTEDGIFLFKIGSEEVLFEPPIRLHLTRQSFESKKQPDGFLAFLRKGFEGKTAASISQLPNERIVEIATKSGERLVFELFRKGNLIAVGQDGKIMACLHIDESGGRKIAKGEEYRRPAPTSFEIKMPQKIGFFVQEGKDGMPISYCVDEPACKEGSWRRFESASEMLDHYYANCRKESRENEAARKKIGKISERLKMQQEALEKAAEKKALARAEGEAIWRNSGMLDSILEQVRKMKKEGASQEQINAFLGKKARLDGLELEVELEGQNQPSNSK
jgi:predicted ribosome quality control (RQC) complex YloA/Tae2 family protein